ncbi:MAG: mechanosensitive ion channel family protein [Nitriliruptoraceae bacterium]
MDIVVAQSTAAEICGTEDTSDRLCELVFEVTGREGLARAVGFGSTAVWIAVTIVAAYLATRLVRRLVRRYTAHLEERILKRLDRDQSRGAITDTQRFRTRRFQRVQATAGVVRGAIGVVIWTTALLIVADLLGIPLQPLLAGAGLAGIVIGFGAQQLVRDVLAGIAMLIEDQYGVGDWIEVHGEFGWVERVGLRSTAFRGVDGTVHHVLNGSMDRVANLSQEWARSTFDVPVGLDADITTAKTLIHEVATELCNDPVWRDDVIGAPEVWGVQEFGPEGIRIRIVIPTKPLRNWDLTRQLRERLKNAFDAAGIRMPGDLVDLGGRPAGYPLHVYSPQPPSTPLGGPAASADEEPEDEAPADEDGATVPGSPTVDDHDQPTEPDATTELRLRQGPRPRPD